MIKAIIGARFAPAQATVFYVLRLFKDFCILGQFFLRSYKVSCSKKQKQAIFTQKRHALCWKLP
ncbi:MAG: hypothetical protein EAZ57_03505 [Cytophagales bacterium]|nr:MAG: hypothetical protein EAZ67_03970 [Cytophagales bacterium]TAF61529.1 MAG: hypothetical protein EAZ57_03505 [Cytophagales bacterium]